MFRPCPKCGNRNHISAFVCPCGYQIIGTPEPELQINSERKIAAPFQEAVPAITSDAFEQPSLQAMPLSEPEELEKQAIREALLAEETQNPARGNLKINLRKSLFAASLVLLIGAMLAVWGGFTGIAGSSENESQEEAQVSLTDNALASDAQALAANNPAGETGIEGKVVGVSSGDTITIADNNNQEYQIKLEGIDAPELEQEFGDEARKNLFTLVFGKTVQINPQGSLDDNTIIGKVWLSGKNVSLEQLKAGLAWHDKNGALEPSENDVYAYHETITKRNGFGLWSAESPLPPWEYRNQGQIPDEREDQAAVGGGGNEETPRAAPNANSYPPEIVSQATPNAYENQPTYIDAVPQPEYVRSSPLPAKSPTVTESVPAAKPLPIQSPPATKIVIVPTAPARKVLTLVSTGYERKPTPLPTPQRTDTLNSPNSPPAKTAALVKNDNPARNGDCFIIKKGKKVYLESEACGN